MSVVLASIYAIHLLFAGLWSGSVMFVTFGVLPTAMNGDADPGPLSFVTDRLRTISRVSALLLFLTGGHLAATFYTAESLTGTTPGYLVLAMVALWLALAALTEIGASKLADGFDANKVREPARNARPFLLAASMVAVLLLVDAGAILGLTR